jgi:hypothetical protein
MRKTLLLAAVLMAACVTSSMAMKPALVDPSEVSEWEALLQYDLGGPLASHQDTVYFGGNGSGTGVVARDGNWNWETARPGEVPEFFDPPFNTDPVGNQFRDGWTFEDRTTRNGPSSTGTGHWSSTGVYNFNIDNQAFAHRAGNHSNTGGQSGPNALVEPGQGGSWSIWIGTNLYWNPENCGWSGGGTVFPRGAGYGDGWSQGIRKTYAINEPAGTDFAIRFYHRYSVEAGFDTDRVEISFDGLFWDQVGSTANPNGIFNGGDGGPGLPDADGEVQTVILTDNWPGGAGNLHVRFRLSSDAFFSDNNEGGTFFYAWQLDNIQLLRNAAPAEPMATFETGLDGWELRQFEGYDFDVTLSNRPAGRIVALNTLACPPIVDCPEACDLEGNILMFADKDDCDLHDSFQDTYATSPPFAIGGPTNPDLDQDEGRLIVFDWYIDGGDGTFETGPSFCWVYHPVNSNNCPYDPPAGAPGDGAIYNWSQTAFATCDFFSMGVGPDCLDDGIDNVSANLPADADSVILHVGAFSQCRSDVACSINDNGAPFYDNLRFGVFNAAGIALASATSDRYTDNFPTSNTGFPGTATARMDGAHSLSQNLGAEFPLRWVRSDTAYVGTGAANAAVFLRWRVTPGPCQPNLNHPFFQDYPANQWNEARMDTARTHGTGVNSAGIYMTCFHEADANNGTFWTGNPPAVEPCDDILPDGLFTAGTKVEYFFEARNASNGNILGTFPAGKGLRPVGTTENFKTLWLESTVLPELVSPGCTEFANNFLVVSDFNSTPVPGRGTIERSRLVATLKSLNLEFDVYDHVGTNFTGSYDGIGRREDRSAQQPRPPFNGATDLMLSQYDCIWYYAGLLDAFTMSDRLSANVPPPLGGQPSRDQQSLETWVEACTAGNNRLLVMEGIGWASDIDVNTNHGAAFLSRFGVDVLHVDYAQDAAANDLRRCARITRRLANLPPGSTQFDHAEILGSGCPDNLPINVFGAVSGGEAVANFVESLENGTQINCADDQTRLAWHAVIRKADATEPCERSVAMSFAFSELNPTNCVNECLFDDYRINGENADLVIEMFDWAGKAIADDPIGIPDPPGAPKLVNALFEAQPNPANPSARIRYTIAEKGQVALKIFDVSGRLVRTLVNQVQEPAETGFEVVWDGMNDGGQRVGSGVFFYQIEAPGFLSAKKLVILK